MIEKMLKIQLIGPKTDLDECVKALHELSVLHIESVPAPEAAQAQASLVRLPIEKDKLALKEKLEKEADRLRNMLLLLKEPKTKGREQAEPGKVFGMLEKTAPVEKKIRTLHAKKDSLVEELSLMNRYERLLAGFAPLVSRLGSFKTFEVTGLVLGRTRSDIAGLLESEVKRITDGRYEFLSAELDEASIGIVMAFPKRNAFEIKKLLTGKAITEVRLPDEYEELTLTEALKKMTVRKAELPALIQVVEKELDDVSAQWWVKLKTLMDSVEDRLDEIGVLVYAAQTRLAFAIEGWVPLRSYSALQERFSSGFKGRVVIRELGVGVKELEAIPVSIKNRGLIRPFEVFLSAMPLPKYGTIDPTPFIAIFFPAFFGLIVADMGYGFLILLISLYIKRRFKTNALLHNASIVFSISSISAIIFGALFGEFFGDLGEELGILQPILFHRSEALKTILALSIGIGAGHVLLGFLLGVVNGLKKRDIKEASLKGAYFLLLVVFAVFIAAEYGYAPAILITPGAALLIALAAVIMAIEGFLAPLELIRTLGNILSYARIMAVGAASVIMALVANRMADIGGALAIGIIAAVALHAINLFLSILSPAIQSMRLHYVEFFSKFYESGGRKYTPFSKK